MNIEQQYSDDWTDWCNFRLTYQFNVCLETESAILHNIFLFRVRGGTPNCSSKAWRLSSVGRNCVTGIVHSIC